MYQRIPATTVRAKSVNRKLADVKEDHGCKDSETNLGFTMGCGERLLSVISLAWRGFKWTAFDTSCARVSNLGETLGLPNTFKPSR